MATSVPEGRKEEAPWAGMRSPSGGHTRVVTKGESSPGISLLIYNLDYFLSQKHPTDVKYRNKPASR